MEVYDLGKIEEIGVPTMIITGNPPTDCDYGRTDTLYPDILLAKQRRSHFITIPQTTQDYNALTTAIQNISKNLTYSIIAQEQHQDGNTHYHICLSFSRPILVKQVHTTILSISGMIAGSINYQEVKHIGKVINYIKKDRKKQSN